MSCQAQHFAHSHHLSLDGSFFPSGVLPFLKLERFAMSVLSEHQGTLNHLLPSADPHGSMGVSRGSEYTCAQGHYYSPLPSTTPLLPIPGLQTPCGTNDIARHRNIWSPTPVITRSHFFLELTSFRLGNLNIDCCSYPPMAWE